MAFMTDSSNQPGGCNSGALRIPEATLMTVWPGIGAFAPGRWVGRLGGVAWGRGFFTAGKVFALGAIPLALGVYAWRLMPFLARRYRLTSRRVVVLRGLFGGDERAIALEGFDEIRVELLPGQAWVRAGDLVFLLRGEEVFRLAGVVHPQVFREVCLEARTALVSVEKVLIEQAAHAA